MSAEVELWPRELRGRERQLRTIRTALERAGRGAGSVTVIRGFAGHGKTRLAEAAAAEARERGLAVAFVPGDPQLADAPLAPLLMALVDVGAALSPEVERHEAVAGIERALRGAAAARPVAVVLDDLQWADAQTLAALPGLTRRLSAHPIAWVLTSRFEFPGTPLAATLADLRAGGAAALECSTLSRADAHLVAREVLGGEPSEEALRWIDMGHNPLLLVELVRGWVEERSLVRRNGRLTPREAEPIPLRLREMARTRLEGLGDALHEIIRAVTLLVDPVPEQLAIAMGLPQDEADALIATSVGLNILAERDGTIQIPYELMRHAVEHDLPPAVRSLRRRTYVRALTDAGRPAPEWVGALLRSSQPGDAEAAELFVRAAEEELASDPAAAAEHAEHALAVGGTGVSGALLARAIFVLGGTGLTARALGLAEALLAAPAPAHLEAAVRLELAKALSPLSWPATAEQARLGLALPELPDGLRAELLSQLHLATFNAGWEVEAAAVVDALLLARRCGAGAAESILLTVQALLAHRRGDLDQALELSSWSVALTRRLRADAAIAPQLYHHALLCCAVGRFADADALVTAGEDGCAALGYTAKARVWALLRARLLAESGQPFAAEAAIARAVTPPLPEPAVAADEAWTDVHGGALALRLGRRLGRTAGAARIVAPAALAAADHPAARATGTWLEAFALADAGEAEAALAVAAHLLDVVEEEGAGLWWPNDLDLPQLVRLARDAGDAERAAAIARAAERRAATTTSPLVLAAARHALGLARGDAAAIEQALTALDGGTRPEARALALEDLAGMRGADGDDEVAPRLLREALDLHRAAGAEREAGRVQRRLRELGVRLRGSAAPGASAALTAAEARVVALVVEGATNREVADALSISPHTVSTHLRRSFQKLGVHSRVELARTWPAARAG